METPPKSNPDADLDDPVMQSLLSYWRSKSGPDQLPTREDINPAEVGASILPHVMLTDVLEGGSRFRYRLAGTAIESAVGQSLAGQYVDEILLPPYRDYILDLFKEVVATKLPLYSESLYVPPDRHPERYCKRLMMPLADASGDVAMVLTGQIFASTSEQPDGHLIMTTSNYRETQRKPL